jgi:hypothetical protein
MRLIVSGLLVGLVCLAASSAVAGGRVMYGYEDSLGMLHVSPNKVNEHYKPLYEGKVDHDTLVRRLREKEALGGPPVKTVRLADLDLGPLPERGARILHAAEPFLGTPYRLGGDTPAGVDCSGLTKAVFARFGCDLPRQSRLQAGLGTPVAAGELAPGDLLFFSTNRDVGINHVGIYLGGGRMLHSSSLRGGVGVDRLPGSRYEAWFVTARRLARATGDGTGLADNGGRSR